MSVSDHRYREAVCHLHLGWTHMVRAAISYVQAYYLKKADLLLLSRTAHPLWPALATRSMSACSIPSPFLTFAHRIVLGETDVPAHCASSGIVCGSQWTSALSPGSCVIDPQAPYLTTLKHFDFLTFEFAGALYLSLCEWYVLL